MATAIIVAKGKSERLPGKNVKLFCGHPLVAWSIVAAVNSRLIDEVYLSTDDDRISVIGTDYGARTIWRDYVEDPQAPANVPFTHAIKKLGLTWGDDIVNILPTSPTVFPWEFDEMLRYKHQLGVYAIHPMSPQPEPTVYRKVSDTQVEVFMFAKGREFYGQGGGFSICDAGWYLENIGKLTQEVTSTEMHPENTKVQHFYERPVWTCFDIDYDFEFDLLEVLMEHYILGGRGMDVYYEYGAMKKTVWRSI